MIVKLLEFIQRTRPDVISLTGPNESGYYEWDDTLENQEEIVSLVNTFIAVPTRVSSRQMRLALLHKGITQQIIDENINNLEEPLKSQIKIAWEYSLYFYRYGDLMNQLATSLSINEEQLNEIFILASGF